MVSAPIEARQDAKCHTFGPGLEHKYIFSEYKVSRIITCALMMLFGIIYSSFSFKGEYIIISTFIIMMKMIDAVEDVFHGNLQQKYHVEQMGKMLAARNLYSAVFFTAMLIITKNLYCTCVATSTTSLILCLIINSQMTRKYVGHEEDGRKLQMSHVWGVTSNLYPYVYRYFSFPAALQHSKIRNGWRYDR